MLRKRMALEYFSNRLQRQHGSPHTIPLTIHIHHDTKTKEQHLPACQVDTPCSRKHQTQATQIAPASRKAEISGLYCTCSRASSSEASAASRPIRGLKVADTDAKASCSRRRFRLPVPEGLMSKVICCAPVHKQTPLAWGEIQGKCLICLKIGLIMATAGHIPDQPIGGIHNLP